MQEPQGGRQQGTGWVTVPGHMFMLLKDVQERTDLLLAACSCPCQVGKAFAAPAKAPTLAAKAFQPPGGWGRGEGPASVSGTGSVVLLPAVGANLLSSSDVALLAESRCQAQISSAVASQL